MKKVRILDCTLRDGGYYNDWDFAPDLVAAYLRAMDASGVDTVEIGFRSLPQEGFLGAFAYSTDDFLNSLPLPKKTEIGVMVNAKELLTHAEGPTAAVETLFQDAKKSPVRLIRLACHFAEVAKTRSVAVRLKEKGYRVGINLMQAAGKSAEELTRTAAEVAAWKAADVLYIADSLGNMDPVMVRGALEALARGWKDPIGIHTHNNMGQALANSIAAVEAGATWIDGTVQGMGRGAGNVATEYLLIEFQKRGWGDFNPDAVFPIVMEEFEQLRRRYGWGPSLLYYLSGLSGVHPTYVQEMLGQSRFTTHHLLNSLEYLGRSKATSYKDDRLEEAILSHEGSGEGAWKASDWLKGRPLLVLGPGPKANAHLGALKRYIENKKPAVICLNMDGLLPSDLVTAYAACHKTRLLMDAEKYRSLKKPLLTPLGRVPETVRHHLSDVKTLDYGMTIEKDAFRVGPTSCTIPASLVAVYVLAVGEAAHASRILLAGFDGYEPSDPRHLEMNRVLQIYRSRPEGLPLLSITPSTYDVPKGSVYSPDL